MVKGIDGRKTYIDIIKGVAMLLVVMHHCGRTQNAGMEMLTMMDVPLFFLCSGFLAYKEHYNYRREISKKAKGILLPFVIALLFVAFLRKVSPIDVFAYDITKSGYWFLEALFLAFVLWYGISAISRTDRSRLLTCATIELLLLVSAKLAPEIIDNIFVISSLVRYFPCFILGIALRKYGDKMLSNRFIGLGMLMAGIAGFSSVTGLKELDFVLCIVAYSCWAILMFRFIKSIEGNLPPLIANSLSIIGKYSMNVYIIHFFLLPAVPVLGYNSFLFDFTYSFAVALVVTALSLIIGKFLTISTPLDKILR